MTEKKPQFKSVAHWHAQARKADDKMHRKLQAKPEAKSKGGNDGKAR